MLQKILPLFLELSNRPWLSSLLKKVSTSRVSKYLIPIYANVYQLSIEEMEKELKDFQTLHELFTRTLKQGMRTVEKGNSIVTSPVDCVVEDIGTINHQKQFFVKGQDYSIEDMLGNGNLAEKYINGTYLILYLSPSHYHRIHSPIKGSITNRFTLGKKSYPVNTLGLKYGKSPLSKNYRVITEMTYDKKHIAVVKVGAMFVNSIEITNPKKTLEKGEEIGYFSFGSTVILLFEKGTFQVDSSLRKKQDVKMGERLGTMM